MCVRAHTPPELRIPQVGPGEAADAFDKLLPPPGQVQTLTCLTVTDTFIITGSAEVSRRARLRTCVRVCVCVRVHVCVRVCNCERERKLMHVNVHVRGGHALCPFSFPARLWLLSANLCV